MDENPAHDAKLTRQGDFRVLECATSVVQLPFTLTLGGQESDLRTTCVPVDSVGGVLTPGRHITCPTGYTACTTRYQGDSPHGHPLCVFTDRG